MKKISNLIFAALFILISIEVKAFVSFKEEEVRLDNPSALYFDQQSLNELIEQGEGDSAETMGQKINAYFSSAPLVLNSNGQFYIDRAGDKQYVRVNMRGMHQKHPVFILPPGKMNQAFARGYVVFISNLATELVDALEKALDISMSIDAAKQRYQNFYYCLENAALTADTQCIEGAIAQVGFAKPQDAMNLANLYIKMYRASRLGFGTFAKVERGSASYKYFENVRALPPIDLRDSEIQAQCNKFYEAFGRLMGAKMQFMKDPLPGGLWSTLAYDVFGGKQRSAKNLKLYHAIPDLGVLTGAYFDVTGKDGSSYVADYQENLGKVCNSSRIY